MERSEAFMRSCSCHEWSSRDTYTQPQLTRPFAKLFGHLIEKGPLNRSWSDGPVNNLVLSVDVSIPNVQWFPLIHGRYAPRHLVDA